MNWEIAIYFLWMPLLAWVAIASLRWHDRGAAQALGAYAARFARCASIMSKKRWKR